MNTQNRVAEFGRRASSIGVWENEGGAPATDSDDHDYGRRVEADRSWTVYHVFTGVPARIDGVTMTGLSRSDATDNMLSLNRRNVVHSAAALLLVVCRSREPAMTLNFPDQTRIFDERRNAVSFVEP
jgi:hypothetical protein